MTEVYKAFLIQSKIQHYVRPRNLKIISPSQNFLHNHLTPFIVLPVIPYSMEISFPFINISHLVFSSYLKQQ